MKIWIIQMGVLYRLKCFFLSFLEDVLSRDCGECSICLDDMLQGDTIARLPCLCIYHKGYEKHLFILSSNTNTAVKFMSSSSITGVLMNGLRSTGRVQNIPQINTHPVMGQVMLTPSSSSSEIRMDSNSCCVKSKVSIIILYTVVLAHAVKCYSRCHMYP